MDDSRRKYTRPRHCNRGHATKTAEEALYYELNRFRWNRGFRLESCLARLLDHLDERGDVETVLAILGPDWQLKEEADG